MTSLSGLGGIWLTLMLGFVDQLASAQQRLSRTAVSSGNNEVGKGAREGPQYPDNKKRWHVLERRGDKPTKPSKVDQWRALEKKILNKDVDGAEQPTEKELRLWENKVKFLLDAFRAKARADGTARYREEAELEERINSRQASEKDKKRWEQIGPRIQRNRRANTERRQKQNFADQALKKKIQSGDYDEEEWTQWKTDTEPRLERNRERSSAARDKDAQLRQAGIEPKKRPYRSRPLSPESHFEQPPEGRAGWDDIPPESFSTTVPLPAAEEHRSSSSSWTDRVHGWATTSFSRLADVAARQQTQGSVAPFGRGPAATVARLAIQ